MRKLYKGLIPLCLLLCICVAMSACASRSYWLYDYNDVQVINRIIDENNLEIPKNNPEKWGFVRWDTSQPKRVTSMYAPFDEQPHTHLGVVDLSELSKLERLYWYGEKTEALILPENLQELNCNDNELEWLDISRAKNLQVIDCMGNALTELDLIGMTDLQFLNCEENQLSRLDLSDCRKLTWLQCSDNGLAELRLSDNSPLLEFIDCENNQLTSLNVAGCYNLQRLHCSNNQLRELTIQDLPEFRGLESVNNPLEQVYLNNLPALESLYCNDNRGAVSLQNGIQFVAFDYPTLTITVKAEPPAGYWLGGITGLPDGVEIVDNTATFQLTYMDRVLSPRFWEK